MAGLVNRGTTNPTQDEVKQVVDDLRAELGGNDFQQVVDHIQTEIGRKDSPLLESLGGGEGGGSLLLLIQEVLGISQEAMTQILNEK